jgi:hypothetical protein
VAYPLSYAIEIKLALSSKGNYLPSRVNSGICSTGRVERTYWGAYYCRDNPLKLSLYRPETWLFLPTVKAPAVILYDKLDLFNRHASICCAPP